MASRAAECFQEELMTQARRVLISGLVSAPATVLLLWGSAAHTAPTARKTITTEAEFHQAMKDLSNWGRWGQDDELGAANLITPGKRKQAAGLVKEGVSVSLEHPIFQEDVIDGAGHLERTVQGQVRPGGMSD